MTFNTVPVQVAGGSSPNRSAPLSVQSTVNMFPQYDDQSSEVFTLNSMYGATTFGSATGAGRGQAEMSGVLYRVSGTTLYSVDSTGSHTSIGTIAGDARCTFATTGSQLAICNGSGQVYAYTATGGLSSVTDPDIVGALVVDIINNQFVYTMPNRTFIISDVGDATAASSLNAAQAEAQPDDLVRAYVFDQIIHMMGAASTEAWINTGEGSPPVLRQDLQVTEKGLIGRYAVTNNDNFMYWLSDDGFVYRMSGLASEVVSSQTISREFQSYSDNSDCVASWFTIEGQSFIMFTFPTQGKTWCLNESLGTNGWFELNVNVTSDNFPYTAPVHIYGKNILESTDGSLVYLNESNYTYQGNIATRGRVLSPISSQSLGIKNKEIRISRLSLLVETGTGLITGQGEDPIIRVEASIDGGRTYTEAGWAKIGRLGDYKQEVRIDFMLTCYECVFKMVCTDPVKIAIYSATADMKLTGKR